MSARVAIKGADLLNGAADRISPPGAWVQGRDAADASGRCVMSISPDARAWCGTGAAYREAYEAIPEDGSGDRHSRAARLYGLLRESLRGMDGMGALLAFNDQDGTTAAQVAAELRRRAELLGVLELPPV